MSHEQRTDYGHYPPLTKTETERDAATPGVRSRPRAPSRRATHHPSRPPTGRKPWTEASVRAALIEFVAGRDTWPTYEEFIAAGAKGLREAVKRIHGPAWWATELQLRDGDRQPGGNRRWTDETIRATLAEFFGERSSWPTRREFTEAGLAGLYEALRHHGGSRRWAVEMKVAPPRARPSGARRRAVPGGRRPGQPRRWTEQRIAAELATFLKGRSEWPRYREFVENGHRSLYRAVAGNGGRRVWAERMGVSFVDRRGGVPAFWTEERVREHLTRMLQGRTRWPTPAAFQQAGEARLLAAVYRTGGVQKWMDEFEIQSSRKEPSDTSQGRPRRWTESAIAEAIAPLGRQLGHWPTKGEFRSAGLLPALAAVYEHGGSEYWRRRLGLTAQDSHYLGPVPNRSRWTDKRIEAELRELCHGRTEWPSVQEFRDLDALPLYRAASRRGGVGKWRALVGLAS